MYLNWLGFSLGSGSLSSQTASDHVLRWEGIGPCASLGSIADVFVHMLAGGPTQILVMPAANKELANR